MLTPTKHRTLHINLAFATRLSLSTRATLAIYDHCVISSRKVSPSYPLSISQSCPLLRRVCRHKSSRSATMLRGGAATKRHHHRFRRARLLLKGFVDLFPREKARIRACGRSKRWDCSLGCCRPLPIHKQTRPGVHAEVRFCERAGSVAVWQRRRYSVAQCCYIIKDVDLFYSKDFMNKSLISALLPNEDIHNSETLAQVDM